MTNIFLLALLFSFTDCEFENERIKADLTLMYRKSGESAKRYQNLSSTDTVYYFNRGNNPYYRVYTIRFNQEDISIGSMILKSYQGDTLKHEVELKPRLINGGAQYVDDYVSDQEDLVELTFQYESTLKRKESDFKAFILLDDKQY